MQMESDEDTIAAIATPPGEGGVAIIRVSGARSFFIADQVFRCTAPPPSQRDAGTFVFGKIVSGEEMIDRGLCLIMRAPRSYTGEDTVELHCHGGVVLARRVLRVVLEHGARLAAPGEYTRRSFVNGKIDLVQAEAVIDSIKATSDRASKAAIEQLEGKLSKTIGSLFDAVISVAADVEASLDFPEDELPEGVLDDVKSRIALVMEEHDRLVKSWDHGRVIREGARVVIAGRPNAGKSTLLNTLLGTDRAIVSPHPGTTRDVVEECFILDGIQIRLIDTAGLRETTCEVEQEGIRRTIHQVKDADVCLYVIDQSQDIADSLLDLSIHADPARTIVVLNKTDIPAIGGRASLSSQYLTAISASLLTGEGIEEIRRALLTAVSGDQSSIEQAAVISSRHRALLNESRDHLKSAADLLDKDNDAFLAQAASHIVHASDCVGRIIGKVYESELLDRIFSRFCIGK